MKRFDLNMPLLQLGVDPGVQPWTLKNAAEGCLITGACGSGKSSASARTIAIKYLKSGFGGLVLTCKKSELDDWREYCELADRTRDLIVVRPDGHHQFDFLKYLTETNTGSNTGNVLEVLKTVIQASEEKSSGKSDDPFWENSLDMLLYHVLDLCQVAGISGIEAMYEIVQTLPKYEFEPKKESKATAFQEAFEKAKEVVSEKIKEWYRQLSAYEQKELIDDTAFNRAVMKALPEARLLRLLDVFFFETFKELSPKTRSIIELSFSSFLLRLMRDPIYSIFCSGGITFRPEDCFAGKIVVLALPVKEYHKVGRDAQILCKYIFQVAWEKRDVSLNDRPLFIFADESQHFIHPHDTTFQATARSSRVCTVYITQNLPILQSAMGGARSKERVQSFIATLNTKIWHANNCVESNTWASSLIGDGDIYSPSRSIQTGEKYSQSDSISIKTEKVVRTENFGLLRTGGAHNDFKAEAYVHVQGDPLFNGVNYNKVKFSQKYK